MVVSVNQIGVWYVLKGAIVSGMVHGPSGSMLVHVAVKGTESIGNSTEECA